MRTTLSLDDQLLISAKHRAIEEKISLGAPVHVVQRGITVLQFFL